MGKIIYNTDDELVFSLQGELGEVLIPSMKDYKFNFSSGGQPDITIGYMNFNISFVMDISEDDYEGFMAFASWCGQGGNFALQFNTSEIASTTLDNAAGKSESDPKLVPLTATTGLTVGQKYFIISDDKLKFEYVEIASISGGVSILTVNDLKYNYSSEDVFRAYRYFPLCLALSLEKFGAKRTGALDTTARGYRRFSFKCKEDLT